MISISRVFHFRVLGFYRVLDLETEALFESQEHNFKLINHKQITPYAAKLEVRSLENHKSQCLISCMNSILDSSSCVCVCIFGFKLMYSFYSSFSLENLLAFYCSISFGFGNGKEIWVHKSKRNLPYCSCLNFLQVFFIFVHHIFIDQMSYSSFI